MTSEAARLGKLREMVGAVAAACALGVVLGSAGGCAYSAPKFEVMGVAVTDETAEGYVLEFSLEGTNENKEALPLGDVHYSLHLAGETVFTGTRSAEATLPRKGSQIIVLPVSVTWGAEHPRLTDDMRYSLTGSVEYELPGTIAEVMFDAKIRRPKAQFVQRGRLDIDPTVDNAPPEESD